MTKKQVTQLSYEITVCAITVHKAVGRVLLIIFYTDNITKSLKPFVNEYFKQLADG